MFPSFHRCNLSAGPNSLMTARRPAAVVWKACAPQLSLALCLKASGQRAHAGLVWSGRPLCPCPTGVRFCSALKWIFSLCEVQTGDAHSRSPFNVCHRPTSGRTARTDLSIWQTYQSSLAERRGPAECQENEEEDDEEVLLPNKSFCFTAFILWHVARVGGLALNNGDN